MCLSLVEIVATVPIIGYFFKSHRLLITRKRGGGEGERESKRKREIVMRICQKASSVFGKRMSL